MQLAEFQQQEITGFAIAYNWLKTVERDGNCWLFSHELYNYGPVLANIKVSTVRTNFSKIEREQTAYKIFHTIHNYACQVTKKTKTKTISASIPHN